MVYFVLVMSGYGAFLLAQRVLAEHGVSSPWAALLAGSFYAFGTWRMNYLAAGQFNLLSSQWILYPVPS